MLHFFASLAPVNARMGQMRFVEFTCVQGDFFRGAVRVALIRTHTIMQIARGVGDPSTRLKYKFGRFFEVRQLGCAGFKRRFSIKFFAKSMPHCRLGHRAVRYDCDEAPAVLKLV